MKKTNDTHTSDHQFRLPFSILEVIISVSVLIIGIFYLIETLPLASMASGSQVGPGGFPLGIAIITVTLTSLLLISSVIKLIKQTDSHHVTFHRFIYVLISTGIIVLIGGNLESLGAFFGTWIMATGIMFCCGERGLRLFILPPCIGAAIYVIFVIALGVYFP